MHVKVFAIFSKGIIFKTDALHFFVRISPLFAINDYRAAGEAIVLPQLDRVAVWNPDRACCIIIHIVIFHLLLVVLCCVRWVFICIKASSFMLTVIVSKKCGSSSRSCIIIAHSNPVSLIVIAESWVHDVSSAAHSFISGAVTPVIVAKVVRYIFSTPVAGEFVFPSLT